MEYIFLYKAPKKGMLLRWQSFGNAGTDLVSLRFELQTSRSINEHVTALLAGLNCSRVISIICANFCTRSSSLFYELLMKGDNPKARCPASKLFTIMKDVVFGQCRLKTIQFKVTDPYAVRFAASTVILNETS